jgi:hypothetical protein
VLANGSIYRDIIKLPPNVPSPLLFDKELAGILLGNWINA